jgi:hypothetical protein
VRLCSLELRYVEVFCWLTLTDYCKALGDRVPELMILPVYGALPSEMQSKIFDPAPPGCRKVRASAGLVYAHAHSSSCGLR